MKSSVLAEVRQRALLEYVKRGEFKSVGMNLDGYQYRCIYNSLGMDKNEIDFAVEELFQDGFITITEKRGSIFLNLVHTPEI